ncbi:hypothetical protein MRY87_01350, partial [bacterium]|nr:hypothetical protein [bacterium]
MSSLQNRFHALLWLLETEKAHLLHEAGRIVFYGAEAHPILQTLSAPLPSNTTTRRVTCHQTFLPKSRGIPKELWTPILPDTEKRPSLILIAGTKSKSANILTLRRAA